MTGTAGTPGACIGQCAPSEQTAVHLLSVPRVLAEPVPDPNTVYRGSVLAAFVLAALLAAPARAEAQGADLTIFVGRAFPTYDERLTLRPSSPSLPGVDVTELQSPVLRADGGSVFGGALAIELGVFAIEGRLDATKVGLEFTGARYELRATEAPFQGLVATLAASSGEFDADRINLLSINARVRTPGPIAIVASGGLSYLPDIRVSGSVPLRLDVPGLPVADLDAALTLRATPGEAKHRFGVNAGAGLRLGGRVGLAAEARAFYFREFDLRFTTDEPLLDDLLAGLAPVRFTPVFVNVQAGIVFRF